MACEGPQQTYDQALGQIDTTTAALDAFDARVAEERQQLVWAVQAAHMQATMAYMLLDLCWQNNGGPPGVVVPLEPVLEMTPQRIFERIEHDRMERSADTE